MKHLASKIAGTTFFALLAVPGVCFAESTPTKTMQAIIDSIKSAGNPSGVVEYVNWDKAFTRLPEAQKAQLKITDPAGMKSFFKDMLTSPSATMHKQLEERLKAIPADKQADAKGQMEKMEKLMQQKEAEMKERISQTEYKISDEKVEGNNATLTLSQTFKGETKSETVKLEKEGDKWMLPALDSMGGQSGGPQPPAPSSAPGVAPGNTPGLAPGAKGGK